MITLVLPYPTVTGNKPRSLADRLAWSRKFTAYKHDVLKVWILGGAKRYGRGPVSITWRVWTPDNRARDWENLEKVLNDAIKGYLIDDDCMTVIAKESREWCGTMKPGRVVLEIGAI